VGSAPDGVSLLPSLDDVLTQVDVLTLHLPLTAETTNIIGPREIGLLRPGATLVNVSRGRLVDEVALADALAKGAISAGLDVLAVEPPPSGAPIVSSPNVILTPHFAWYSASSERRVRTEVLAGMLDYLRGQPPRTGRLVIDPRESAGGR
jgi:phosphoglycerate dehydrogenase-like enzyme